LDSALCFLFVFSDEGWGRGSEKKRVVELESESSVFDGFEGFMILSIALLER